ncbi:MAG: CoA ester lyase [Pseudomonadota bacterium]
MRSVFFAPANRPELLLKFQRFAADCSVIDLEDGTPSVDKLAAQASFRENARAVRDSGYAGSLFARVNAPDTEWHEADLDAVCAADIDGIVIPKLERVEQLASVSERRRDNQRVLLGIESIAGVLNAEALCRAETWGDICYFGAEDLAAQLGARRTAVGDEVLYARSRVLLAARAAGIVAIDQAVVDIRDADQYRRDASRGRDLGYDGKLCVHPSQVVLANEVFSPSAEEIEYASALIETYRTQQALGVGTIDFRGQMVDEPILKRAEGVMDTALALGLVS